MLRRNVEYVLSWNAADHAWEARPIRREGERIVHLDPGADEIAVPPVIADAPNDTWND